MASQKGVTKEAAVVDWGKIEQKMKSTDYKIKSHKNKLEKVTENKIEKGNEMKYIKWNKMKHDIIK